MATTQADIRFWLNRGKSQNATHVIVVVDTYDHTDYPVYVSATENVRDVFANYDGRNMQRVMEVYSLSMDFEEQLNQYRAFNF